MTLFQKENFVSLFKLIDNSIQMFYTASELFIIASEYELHLLHALIQPRVELMRKAIKGSSLYGLMRLECDAYHVVGRLELDINKKIYEEAVNKIKETYLKYI